MRQLAPPTIAFALLLAAFLLQPAFECRPTEASTPGSITATERDLRDQFAGKALTGLISNRELGRKTEGELSRLAYQQADAMLTERSRKR